MTEVAGNRHWEPQPTSSKPMNTAHAILTIAVAAAALAGTAAGEPQAPPERYKLYTPPEAGASGGISGRVAKPDQPVEQVLAIPADAPEKVYQGELDSDKRGFRFSGLPMRKYDLLVVFEKDFYEGLQLQRGENSLTDEDRKKIEAIVQKSEPYFTHKIIHRVEGETGRGNFSRAICTFLRAKGSELLWNTYKGEYHRDDFRRTFKLVILKDVGPGWQIVRTRDLYPVWTTPQLVEPKHHFHESLAGVRVADKVKELGELDLTK